MYSRVAQLFNPPNLIIFHHANRLSHEKIGPITRLMDNRDCVRKFLAIRLKSAIELPGMLQQNDVCSGNLFQGVEELMDFDFSFCSIVHPAM